MTTNDAHLNVPGRHGRREFLRRSALVTGAGVAAPWAMELAGVGAASAEASGDYKALVCVFLHGGNDHYDTMVPNDDAGHRAYAAARGRLTRSKGSLLRLAPRGGFVQGRSIGLVPEWKQLHGLYGSGDLAIVSNVGTLVRPVTKADIDRTDRVPPQLFSHNDQASLWQSSAPEGATTGWGGRLGDLLLDANGERATFTCISASGNAVMLAGRRATQFQVSARGVIRLDLPFNSPAPQAGLEALMRRTGQSDVFSRSYAELSRRALDTSEFLANAIDATGGVSTAFPETRLAAQLKTVADLIRVGRERLGVKRQVFFVSIGGFDNHSDLDTEHSALLTEMDDALGAFHRATGALGARNQVTTFTASDFGRTLTGNGDGSDHGWGAHHIVMGGAVAGGRVYGDLPAVAVDGPDDVGQGRTVPSIAVDQYAATMASWMGASSGELSSVVPNIGRFATADLGFMGGAATGPVGGLDGDDRVDGAASVLRRATRLGPRSR